MEVSLPTVSEKLSPGTSLHFEPGIHPTADKEVKAVYDTFSRGDLEAHLWNTPVRERIASYAYDASGLLLTIDSLSPQPPSNYSNLTPHDEAVFTWVLLPGRPHALTQRNSLYVVKGDIDYHRLPQAIFPDRQESDPMKQEIQTIFENHVATSPNAMKTAVFAETAGIGAIGAGLWAANKFLTPANATQKLSRRQFLDKTIKTATTTLVTGSLLRPFVPYGAAEIPNEPAKELLQTVADGVRPRLVRSSFTDGRTALLIAKAEDTQAIVGDLAQATNVVVMGNAHTDIAPTYLQDREQRNEIIATYVQELLEIAKQLYRKYSSSSPDQTPPHVIQSVLNYVSQVDIVKVTDPGGPSFQLDFPSSVEKHITPYKSFKSPQVEEAIKHLRP